MADFSPHKANAGTITSVASSASSVTLLAQNSNRRMATVYNDSTQVLYIALSAGPASTSSYTVQVAAGGYYEIPSPISIYTGPIFGIWASANGNARVCELV